MSSYVKATNFATKDTLPTGDSNKIVKGTELDNEFNAIAGAVSSKADLASPTFTGTPAAPTATAGSNTTQLATTAFVATALQSLYPVGSVYINASNSSNPSSVIGFGTWTAFGAGRVLVGFDSSNTLFDTAEETGGSADAIVVSHTHSASTASSGAHTHAFNKYSGESDRFWGASDYLAASAAGGNYNLARATTDQQNTVSIASNGAHSHTVTIDTTGSSGTNANYQPYITVYMWKRTA